MSETTLLNAIQVLVSRAAYLSDALCLIAKDDRHDTMIGVLSVLSDYAANTYEIACELEARFL